MVKKIKLQDLRLDTRYKKLKEVAGTEFPKIKKFIEASKIGKTSGRDISEETERKYIDCFIMGYKNIRKKKLLSLTERDLENLKRNLKNEKIVSRTGRAFKPSTQREMQIILLRFLFFINPKKYANLKKWFVIKIPKKSVEWLEETEIEKLMKACKTNEERFIIAVLFDTGARASEFLNLRFEDVREPTQAFPYFKFLFREEYSKTQERGIGLYWKKSTEVIKDYLSELDRSDLKKPIITKNYDTIRFFLTRLGMKVLKKRLHFHLFRKSSASYYADKLNRQQLCFRYGWAYSSDMPDIYIKRNLGEEGVKEKIFNTDLEKLEKENQEIKTRLTILQEAERKRKEEEIEKEKKKEENLAKWKKRIEAQIQKK